MGALTAAVSRERGDIVPKIVKMMETLRHRGNEAYGVATSDAVKIGSSSSEAASGLKSPIAIGHNLSRILLEDNPQPVQSGTVKLVFEGRLCQPQGEPSVEIALRTFGSKPLEGAELILKGLEGAYTFAAVIGDGLIVGRDPLGLAPLYYGEGRGFYAAASERKALWAVGVREVKSFPPGHVAYFSASGCILKPVRVVTEPEKRSVSMEDAVKTLGRLLREAVRRRAYGLRRVALAFSGGLDSSILAAFLKDTGVEVQLVTVGFGGEVEIRCAREAADALGLPLHVRLLTESDVERLLPRVLWLVEEPSHLAVSVGIPFYYVAEAASELGLRVLFAGQGSDELFGGYSKYLDVYKSLGVRGVWEALYQDVKGSYERNFERDEKVCSFHHVELRLPFADWSLTTFALSLPVDLKICSPQDPLRKRVLRRLAEEVGLPPEVYGRRKKAIQYATGVDKALRRLAKKRKMTIKGLIEDCWRRMEWENPEPP